MRRGTSPRRVAGLAAALVAATLVAYAPLRHNGFVAFDDNIYITENPDLQRGLSWESVRWAFRERSVAYWHPVTWLSLLLDQRLFGLDPRGYHFTNLALHVLAAVGLQLALWRATGRLGASTLVAGCFALHPLNVEAVAWAVERKTVLSGLLRLVTVAAYGRYAARPSLSRYLPLPALFVLGLMAKPAVIGLPFALLVLDFWPLRRLAPAGPEPAVDIPAAFPPCSVRRAVLEKLPLVVIAVGSAAASMATTADISHRMEEGVSPLANRAANAIVSYAAYLAKTAWPVDLGVFYPPRSSNGAAEVAVAAGVLVGITVLAARWWRSRPWLVAGWLWYLGLMVPAIGLVRAGLWPAMADRFAYLPLVGAYVAVAFTVDDLARRSARARLFAAGAGVAALLALVLVTQRQVGHWRDSLSLWDHTVRVTAANAFALERLGIAQYQAGDRAAAFATLGRAQALDPGSAEYELYQAYQLVEHGDCAGALPWIDRGLARNDSLDEARNVAARCHELGGDLQAAHALYARIATGRGPHAQAAGLRRDSAWRRLAPAVDELARRCAAAPADLQCEAELAELLYRLGRFDDALQRWRAMERHGPASWPLYYNLGNAARRLGRVDEAIRYYRQSVAMNPAHGESWNNLGNVLDSSGDRRGALGAYERAVAADPGSASAAYNLARAYYKRGDRARATAAFERVRTRFPELEARVARHLKLLRE